MVERPFRSRVSADGRVLVVSGLLDELSTPELRTAVCEATGGYSTDLVVDLSDVDFLPSVALGVLVAATRAGTADVTLLAHEESLAARVLEMSGLPFATVRAPRAPVTS